ncbi:uncharacterized protein SAPINGB_P003075 [Magnusiomyces paraingens]|uniref:Aminoglycoside phosphotransferase domain-containing protein n=1 Tax=Magnusiomyces paraingens TaxID=2606893 RepID=A0A5E8BPD2_9ASCO|nr:uncharacterized protein SAPINGB_P003075 [Saprochaete ingens]VVT51375.1 unnamed protein product [Saprochaete ingens]
MAKDEVDTEAGLGAIRHSIDQKSLETYLTKNFPAEFVAPFTLQQFGFGQSNPSYQVKDALGRKYVLRKKPPGKLVSKTAHAVDREYAMLKALYEIFNGDIPVPRVICLCQDPDVIGSDFYMMEFVKGRIFHYPTLPDLSPKDRRECWQSAVKTLAKLHSVDPRKLPPIFTKRLESHYPRQLGSLSAVAKAQAAVTDIDTGKTVGPIPQFEEIVKWMAQHMPKERVTIVHGDYKIDNLIFHPTENKVIAILDWELCTVGHPLADLGNLMQPFSWPESLFGEGFGLQDTAAPLPQGLPTVQENLELYTSLTGYDASKDWTFAIVSAHFRLSVIAHGIKARVARKQASSENAAKHAESVGTLARLAIEEIEKTEKKSKI